MLKPVAKAEFFAALHADPRDIMPSIRNEPWHPEHGYTSEWKDTRGALFGVSTSTEYRLYAS